MNQVTIYTTNTCPYCDMMKNFLNEEGLSFKEVNVQRNPSVVSYLINATGRMGVPQTEINGQWVVGYDPEKAMKFIK